MMNLTKMEKMVLNSLRNNDYNDCYTDPCTWAFAAIDYSGLNAKQARGVMASLIKKGLMGFQEDDDEDIVWLTDEGKKIFETAAGEECNWGGPRLLEIEDEVEEVKENEREEKTMTVKEMRAEAKEMGIKGYSRLSKKELQTVIAVAKSANRIFGKQDEKTEAETEEKTTVTVRAFTGMLIGEFEVTKETKKLLVVKTKKGDELKFDKATGLQTNGNNPKFANRIEL